MEFNALMQQFAAKFDISNLTIEDDAVALEIDEMAFGFINDPAVDTLTIVVDLGQQSINANGALGAMMLKANFLFQATKGATLFQNPENDAFGLQQMYRLLDLDVDKLSAEVEKLANMAEEWKAIIAGCSQAENAAEERNAQDASISTGGFIQV